MRYQFMQKYRKEFSIEKMAKVFKVSARGYYAYNHRKPSMRDLENEELLILIKQIHKEGRFMYGSPRIHAKLCRLAYCFSRKRVANLMKKMGIAARMRKKWKKTTKQGKRKSAKNLIEQNFISTNPDEKWVSDITYVHTREGWLYVSTILDLFSRRVVGLSMGEKMDTALIKQSLGQALKHRNPPKGLIHHSDRGSQYTSEEFERLAKEHGIILSMSSTGNCFDNAVAESFFHTLKTEHVYQRRFETREEAKRSIFEYIEVFYNRQRLHSFLGYLSPEEYETNWEKRIA